jgi:hypothetical protein
LLKFSNEKFILANLVSILAIFLAVKFVPGVTLQVIPGRSVYFGIKFTQDWQILIFIELFLD